MAVTDNVMCKGQGQGFVVDTGEQTEQWVVDMRALNLSGLQGQRSLDNDRLPHA